MINCLIEASNYRNSSKSALKRNCNYRNSNESALKRNQNKSALKKIRIIEIRVKVL